MCTVVLGKVKCDSRTCVDFILVLVQVRTGPYAFTTISTLWMEVNQQLNWTLISVTITTLFSPFLYSEFTQTFSSPTM